MMQETYINSHHWRNLLPLLLHNTMTHTPPSLLTIAGTDPTSAAGIQVDLNMFAHLGFHGTSVITAILWQDTSTVHGWHIPPTDVLSAQLAVITHDIPPAAIKIGVLPNPDAVRVVGNHIQNLYTPTPVVHDPVLSNGDDSFELVTPHTLEAMKTHLFPHISVLTPNLLEAAKILGCPMADLATQDLCTIATHVQRTTQVPFVLIKAGHAHTTTHIQDALASQDTSVLLSPLPKLNLQNHGVRGTGCQLSSAITARIAQGNTVIDAVELARKDLHNLLKNKSFSPGKGRHIIGYFTHP